MGILSLSLNCAGFPVTPNKVQGIPPTLIMCLFLYSKSLTFRLSDTNIYSNIAASHPEEFTI